MFETIAWDGDEIVMIDQRVLPEKEVYLRFNNVARVIWGIQVMVIRGAPAIGDAAAMGVALGASKIKAKTRPAWDRKFREICDRIAAARPTAVNLVWAVRRMERLVAANPEASPQELVELLRQESELVLAEDIESCKAMGRVGAAYLPDKATVLTHCNAGGLATGGYGTALGVIRAAVEAGKEIRVIADETRPFLQGARLTAWELHKDNIPVTVVPDSMAASMMAQGMIDAVVVGSDRIAINGDVANKIGTYSVSLAAKEHGVPFYVAAPCSTVDPDCAHGDLIPIEQRVPTEVTHIGRKMITPVGVPVGNQAFDVTPAKNVTAIFTETGAAKPPNKRNLSKLLEAVEPKG